MTFGSINNDVHEQEVSIHGCHQLTKSVPPAASVSCSIYTTTLGTLSLQSESLLAAACSRVTCPFYATENEIYRLHLLHLNKRWKHQITYDELYKHKAGVIGRCIHINAPRWSLSSVLQLLQSVLIVPYISAC